MTSKQRSKLKSLANNLRPAVTIGKEELSENVLNEISTALLNHELVKVATLQSCAATARSLCEQVCEILGCEPVLCIGNRFIVYKFSDKEGVEHIVF